MLVQSSGPGPRNVLVRREDGALVVRPARGLRRAVARTYASGTADGAKALLAETAGTWRQRRFDGEAYVEAMRSGTAARLER